MQLFNSEFFRTKRGKVLMGSLVGITLVSGLTGCTDEPNFLEVHYDFNNYAYKYRLYSNYSTAEELEQDLINSGLYSSDEIANAISIRNVQKRYSIKVNINGSKYLLCDLFAHVTYNASDDTYMINICEYNNTYNDEKIKKWYEIENDKLICEEDEEILEKHCHYKILDIIPDELIMNCGDEISYDTMLECIKSKYAEDIIYADSRVFSTQDVAKENSSVLSLVK